ncbi:MAG: phosphoribosyltransferase [Terriglobales bacterium]
MIYKNRIHAGHVLAQKLRHYAKRPDVLVLGLPRGGVPVAYEIAVELHVPMDVFVVRKLGVPGHRELAMGAIASGGVMVLNKDVLESLAIPEQDLNEVFREELSELLRREQEFRGAALPLQLTGRTAILVDDGLATGASMRAAVQAARRLHPSRLVVAVPVAARSTCASLSREADEIICGETPEHFEGVSQWYEDFNQTSDDEVRKLLSLAREKYNNAA